MGMLLQRHCEARGLEAVPEPVKRKRNRSRKPAEAALVEPVPVEVEPATEPATEPDDTTGE